MNTEQESNGAPIKILLVDDEVRFVEVLQKRLNKRGLETQIAFSGSEAILLLRASLFDVAVLDLKMKDMDGIEVLKVFKKMDPDMPVIILTGHGSEQAAVEGTQYGAFSYLIKPCDFNELLDAIRKAAHSGRVS